MEPGATPKPTNAMGRTTGTNSQFARAMESGTNSLQSTGAMEPGANPQFAGAMEPGTNSPQSTAAMEPGAGSKCTNTMGARGHTSDTRWSGAANTTSRQT